MEKLFEQNYREEDKEKDGDKAVISALQKEIRAMEEAKPDVRSRGKGDPKYESLFSFVQKAEREGFERAYGELGDCEKHAIITRLENRARENDIPFDFVEPFRRTLYGTRIDDEGTERIDYEKQRELEQVLQEKYFKKEI